MFDSERGTFGAALDKLAEMLNVAGPEDWQKDRYFRALKKLSPERFYAGLQVLEETYEPRNKNDFPVISTIVKACESIRFPSQQAMWNCRCAACKKPFPAERDASGKHPLNCDCDFWNQCWNCDRCKTHCNCGNYLDMADKVPDIVAECNKILDKFRM